MSVRHTKWRWASILILFLAVVLAAIFYLGTEPAATKSQNVNFDGAKLALTALPKLAIKPAAPMSGYSRAQFGGSWETVGGCDMREHILAEDLALAVLKSRTDCTVLSGVLNDPYSGKVIDFRRSSISGQVQIDHIVALGDAWRTGAQTLSVAERQQLYNDPLELIAVDGPTNDQKGDSDAASWLPPNKNFDCAYVARQIAVKLKYELWVTLAEHQAMQKVLNTCPGQPLPLITN